MFLTDHFEDTYSYFEIIQEKMSEYQKDFILKLTQVINPSYVEKFAIILTNEWFECCSEAKETAEDLEIQEIHFFAFRNDFNKFKELYEETKNECHFD